MTFEETVRAMTIDQLIMAMVIGLRHPKVRLDMGTFGKVIKKEYFFGLYTQKVCYGCAATNTICQIADVTFTPENIKYLTTKSEAVNATPTFLSYFEQSIEELRRGNLDLYNFYAQSIGIALIPGAVVKKYSGINSLPHLNTEYTNDELQEYAALAYTLLASKIKP